MARMMSFMQNCVTNIRQIVPHFAARFSGLIADLEAPADDSGKHWGLVQDAVY